MVAVCLRCCPAGGRAEFHNHGHPGRSGGDRRLSGSAPAPLAAAPPHPGYDPDPCPSNRAAARKRGHQSAISPFRGGAQPVASLCGYPPGLVLRPGPAHGQPALTLGPAGAQLALYRGHRHDQPFPADLPGRHPLVLKFPHECG